jgi:hypothetical protein
MGKFFRQTQTCDEIFFLRKSQVKSPKSQVMTLTFFKERLKNTFRRFL